MIFTRSMFYVLEETPELHFLPEITVFIAMSERKGEKEQTRALRGRRESMLYRKCPLNSKLAASQADMSEKSDSTTVQLEFFFFFYTGLNILQIHVVKPSKGMFIWQFSHAEIFQ